MDLITKSLLCIIMEDRANRRRSAKCMGFLTTFQWNQKIILHFELYAIT